MRLRFTAAAAAIASIVSFALGVVLLTAGADPSNANDDYWVALNTTGVGSNLITVGPAESSSSSSSSTFGSIIGEIPGLEPLLNNITSSVGSGLSDVQGEVVGALTSALGLKNLYLLYASKMCDGTLMNNDSISGISIDSCYSYHDGGQGLMNISNSIPSSLTIANSQVAVPAVSSLQSSLKNIVNLAVGMSTALMVLLIIACIGSGATAIGSVLGIVRPKARLLVILNLGFSTVTVTAISLLATTLTTLVLSIASSINGFGSGVSLNIKTGTSFLAIIWVATLLAAVSNLYWFIVWFVEFRKTSFSRRSRTKNQIGNWWGIMGEVKRDIKTDGYFPPPDEYGEHGNQKTHTEKNSKGHERGGQSGGRLSLTTL